MRQLARRARNVYREAGPVPVVTKSSRFLVRKLRHDLGARGLYRSERYLRVLQWTNAGYGRYEAIADPFKIVSIDPHEIEYVTARGPNPGQFQWQDLGTVQGGDWDRSDEGVEDLPVVRALRQRFEEGRAWEDIPFIQRVRTEAERGNPLWRDCTSSEDVDRACEQVDKLYERIRTEGYRSKRELLNSGDIEPRDGPTGRFESYDEVVVDVGRDGEFLFVDGRHRLAIARILDLGEIPVRISARHADWQRARDEYAAGTNPAELPDRHGTHPDLQDVLSDERE